jgi:hypothetical protein
VKGRVPAEVSREVLGLVDDIEALPGVRTPRLRALPRRMVFGSTRGSMESVQSSRLRRLQRREPLPLALWSALTIGDFGGTALYSAMADSCGCWRFWDYSLKLNRFLTRGMYAA